MPKPKTVRRPSVDTCECGDELWLVHCGVDHHQFMGVNYQTGETNKQYLEWCRMRREEPRNGRVYIHASHGFEGCERPGLYS